MFNTMRDILIFIMFVALVFVMIGSGWTFSEIKNMRNNILVLKNQQAETYIPRNKVSSVPTSDNRVVKVIAPRQFTAEMTVIDGHDYLVLHDLSVPSVNIIHYSDCKRCKRR